MKRVVLSLIALAGLVAGGLLLLPRLSAADVPAPPKPGAEIADFTLDDPAGKAHSLKSLADGKPAAVVFVATKCPYSNAYNEVMSALAKKYAGKVALIGINSNKTEPPPDVAKHKKERGLSFPVLVDPGSKIADRFGARYTPEVYLVDAKGKLVYHGSLGNSADPTADAEEANSEEITIALDQVLAGEPVKPATRKAFGCTIKR